MALTGPAPRDPVRRGGEGTSPGAGASTRKTTMDAPATTHEVFISYSAQDRDRVLAIDDQLEAAGVSVWVDRHKIPGGGQYGPEIVSALKACKVLALLCSAHSLSSRNVKQEIQIAWKYERPYLPLLLEPVTIPEQFLYWLEG